MPRHVTLRLPSLGLSPPSSRGGSLYRASSMYWWHPWGMPEAPTPDEWTDLASVPAGEGVRRKARQLRDEAPVRTFIARVLGVHTDERSWRVGAEGERLVAAQLAKLGPGWHVVNSVLLSEQGTDLDHLVIGPAGVFCINTKNHPKHKVWVGGDVFMVNGQRQTYVRASRSEGRKVSRLLSAVCPFELTVKPVIAVVNAELEVKQQPADVSVVGRRWLAKWLRSQPPRLGPTEVELVFDAARRSTTWSPSPAPRPTGERQAPGASAQERTGEAQAPGPAEPLPAGLEPEEAPITGTPEGDRNEVPVAAGASTSLEASAEGMQVADLPTSIRLIHTSKEGTVVRGDPRPHQALLKAAGFRWSGPQRCWYLPGSRGKPVPADQVGRLVAELNDVGFVVKVEIALISGPRGNDS